MVFEMKQFLAIFAMSLLRFRFLDIKDIQISDGLFARRSCPRGCGPADSWPRTRWGSRACSSPAPGPRGLVEPMG